MARSRGGGAYRCNSSLSLGSGRRTLIDEDAAHGSGSQGSERCGGARRGNNNLSLGSGRGTPIDEDATHGSGSQGSGRGGSARRGNIGSGPLSLGSGRGTPIDEHSAHGSGSQESGRGSQGSGRGVRTRGGSRSGTPTPSQERFVRHTHSPPDVVSPSTPVEDAPTSNQISSRQSSSIVPSGVLETGEPSSRMMIWPNGKEFYPIKTVSKIATIIKSRYPEPWLTWKEVPIEHRTMWFEDFKTKCKWDEHDHDDIVRIWRQKSAEVIRNSFADIRREQSDGSWCGKNVLAALKERWRSDPKFKKMSAQNKKNSTSNKECRVNRGGAISITERKLRYEKALGRTVSISEVFQKINFDEKKDKWLTPAAENVYHTFKKMKEDASSQGKNMDDSAMFLKASGGKKMLGRSDLGQKWHSMDLDQASILKLPNLAQWKLRSSKNVFSNWRN